MKKALFLLTSPFQILCALEARNYFKIDKSLFLFFTDPDTENCIQMKEVGNKYGIDYKILNRVNFNLGIKSICLKYLRNFVLEFKIYRYDYIFIGDARERVLCLFGITCLKKSGKMVYLDDGNVSLLLLSSKLKLSEKSKKLKSVIKYWTGGNELFFTIYKDISSDNYKILPNQFLCLRKEISKKEDVIYILGTPVSIFCEYYGLSIQEFQKAYEKLLKFLLDKYPGKKIVYIPHRREKYEETSEISSKNGIIIKKLHCPIEKYLLESSEIPSVVCGFGTSALYTISLLFPSIKLYNVALRKCMNKTHYQEIELIYDYYEKNHIINLNY